MQIVSDDKIWYLLKKNPINQRIIVKQTLAASSNNNRPVSAAYCRLLLLLHICDTRRIFVYTKNLEVMFFSAK